MALLDRLRRGAVPKWFADALCREYRHVDFFAAAGQPAAEAKAVCGRCIVATECASYHAALPPELAKYGTWAGETETERKGGPAPEAAKPCRLCGADVDRRGAKWCADCREERKRRQREERAAWLEAYRAKQAS